MTADDGHTLGGFKGESFAHVPRNRPKPASGPLRLVNLEFRGKALDVVISRLPSGRVVRRVTVKSAGH